MRATVQSLASSALRSAVSLTFSRVDEAAARAGREKKWEVLCCHRRVVALRRASDNLVDDLGHLDGGRGDAALVVATWTDQQGSSVGGADKVVPGAECFLRARHVEPRERQHHTTHVALALMRARPSATRAVNMYCSNVQLTSTCLFAAMTATM